MSIIAEHQTSSVLVFSNSLPPLIPGSFISSNGLPSYFVTQSEFRSGELDSRYILKNGDDSFTGNKTLQISNTGNNSGSKDFIIKQLSGAENLNSGISWQEGNKEIAFLRKILNSGKSYLSIAVSNQQTPSALQWWDFRETGDLVGPEIGTFQYPPTNPRTYIQVRNGIVTGTTTVELNNGRATSNIESSEINFLQHPNDASSKNGNLNIKRAENAADSKIKFINTDSNKIAQFFKAGSTTLIPNYKGNTTDSYYSTNINKGDFLIESWNDSEGNPALDKWIYIKLDAANQIVEIPNIKLANETDDLLTMIQKIRVRGLFGY